MNEFLLEYLATIIFAGVALLIGVLFVVLPLVLAPKKPVHYGALFPEESRAIFVREALLTVSSDWPFMVSKDTAAQYAVNRAHTHAHATRELCDAAMRGRGEAAARIAANWARADNLFAGLDARRIAAIESDGG